jgi:hypothetical protein
MFAPIPIGATLASFLETMPPWYAKSSSAKPTAYPVGAYDPQPVKTWLSALDAHRVMHPDMVESGATDSRMRSHETDHADTRHGAVMARESILGREGGHSWGDGANDCGDGKTPGEGGGVPEWMVTNLGRG